MSVPARFYGPALLSTSPTTLFTAAASKRSLIELIHVMNESASSATLTLSIGTDGSGTRIYDSFTFRPNEMRAITTYLVLNEGEVFQGFSGSASAILLTVSGRVSDVGGWGYSWGSSFGG